VMRLFKFAGRAGSDLADSNSRNREA
jgi:hypothetical protein